MSTPADEDASWLSYSRRTVRGMGEGGGGGGGGGGRGKGGGI